MKTGREARRRSDKDEFVYLPPGITYYRTLPDNGWRHAQPCDCEFCRAQR